MNFIKDFKNGTYVDDQFVITQVSKSIATTGKEYYRMTLKDASGTIQGVKWSVYPGEDEFVAANNIVYVSGVVEIYGKASTMQIRIDKIAPVPQDQVIVARFVKNPPVPREQLVERFNKHLASISDYELQLVIKTVLERVGDKFYEYPAAVSVHHDFSSGLLYHTISMADLGVYLSSYYVDVDKDLLLTAILLHDIAKTIEFEGDVSFKYSLEGKLLGHISIGMALVREIVDELGLKGEKFLLLEHMILSHHGQLEYGSPVLPQTREAILLNLIDNLDSKMAVADKALEDVLPGEMSQKIFALDNRILYKPKKQ